MDDLTIDTLKVKQIENVINNVLQTNNVKYPMDQFMVVKDTLDNFLPCLYVIWNDQNYGPFEVGYIEAGNNPANNWYNMSEPEDPGNPYATYEQLVAQQNMVYDTIKTIYTEVVITSPGFEFLDTANGTNYDALATEHWLELGGGSLNPENDELWAALNVQFNLLRVTLKHNGVSVLSGFNSMLITYERTMCPAVQGSLTPDRQPTQHVKVTAFLWEKLREYSYNSRVSGEFDVDDTVWAEKFEIDDLELYIFFKPFPWPETKRMLLLK